MLHKIKGFLKPLAIVYLDSSAFGPPELLDRVAVVRFVELEQEYDALSILVPWFLQALSPAVPLSIQKYIENYLENKISTIPVAYQDRAKTHKLLIQHILYPDQDLSPDKMANIEHIFEAITYHAVFFVTTNSIILSKAPLLYKKFKLQVMRPSQCLPVIEAYLSKDQSSYVDLFQSHQ